jgi:hypothetical protein
MSRTTDEGTDAPIVIEEVRQLLQKEMAEKGTLAVTAASGDGWEAHVMENINIPRKIGVLDGKATFKKKGTGKITIEC